MASCEQRIERHPRTFAPSHHRTLICGQILNVIAPPFTRVSRRAGIGVAVSILFAVAVAPGPSPAAAQPRGQAAAFPCDVQTTERIVAVGDVHGAFDQFVAILRTTGLIDMRNRWIGKKAVLVQTGDVLDRGPDSKKALDLLRKLEGEAQRAGGRVVALLGNHELMRLVSDWRYVSQGETDAFKNADSVDLRDRAFVVFSTEAEKAAKAVGKPFDAAAYREQFMKEMPLGSLEMRFAFDAKGEYGAWVRQRAAVARINGILFLHGGVSDTAASLGCEGINAAVRKDLLVAANTARAGADALLGERNRSALVSGARQRIRSVAGPDARLDPPANGRARHRDRPHDRAAGKNQHPPRRPRHSDRHGDGERRVLSRRRRLSPRAARRHDDGDLSRSTRATAAVAEPGAGEPR